MQKENPTWKLPERRVTKFVKKQIKKKGKDQKDTRTHDDEDSLASQPSITRRMTQNTKKKLGAVFKRGKKKDKSSEKMPPTHIHTDAATLATSIVSPISSVGEEEEPKVVEEKVVETKAENAVEEQEEVQDARNLSVVYEDDNDGSKEGQFCGACAGCAIL